MNDPSPTICRCLVFSLHAPEGLNNVSASTSPCHSQFISRKDRPVHIPFGTSSKSAARINVRPILYHIFMTTQMKYSSSYSICPQAHLKHIFRYALHYFTACRVQHFRLKGCLAVDALPSDWGFRLLSAFARLRFRFPSILAVILQQSIFPLIMNDAQFISGLKNSALPASKNDAYVCTSSAEARLRNVLSFLYLCIFL